jgi:hypothetical protein
MRYEEILPELGDRFEAEVRAALLRTVELPESAPVYAGERPHCFISIPIETAITAIGTKKTRFSGSVLHWFGG